MSGGLLSEFLDAAERVTPAVERAMKAAGAAFLVNGLPRYGIARINIHGDLFEPAEDGIPALIVAELFGGIKVGVKLEDTVAYLAGPTPRWFRRRGAIDALGQEAIWAAQGSREPLTLYRTPLSWLARPGACLVNWRADPRAVFHGVSEIRCEDAALAKRLKARIDECSLPRPAVTFAHAHRRAA